MSQYIPGADSPENQQKAQAAEQEFMKVLEKDPKDTVAIGSLASLHYNQAQGNQPMEKKMQSWRKRRSGTRSSLQLIRTTRKPTTASASSPGQSGIRRMSARAKLGMKPEDPGPIKDKKVREELKAKCGPVVEEGIANLKKALEIDPEYDDAMAYENLLIRERADLADSKDDYEKDIQDADNWVQKALETKKIKAERVANKGAVKAE